MISSLNSFARLASNRSEVVGGCFILLVIVMMVIPMSPIVLDVLIAFNICITVVLVLSAVLLDSPLSFSSFPAILLMTTLFRLSLTISTTRQILLEAHAGEIVATFGQFVVGGNVAVGLVIFLIISVVNFLVVTKGSERVAEVAARFSLDAMPGKQMSIDGDLRAGNLSQDQAKAKRSELEKESQLFGAMDGAIKFVKNDAIAGLVITLINLVGGLTIGMVQKGMDFSSAAKLYSILTVGDGLVAIIPSLMTSIAAGLIVTRVTKGESDGANTAQDVIRELTSNRKALQISSVFCLMFAFVPGMPSAVFVVAAGLIWYQSNKKTADEKEEEIDDPGERFEKMLVDLGEKRGVKAVDDLMESAVYSPLEVRFPKFTDDPLGKSRVFSIIKFTRNQLIEEIGIVYPVFAFKEDEKVAEVQINVFGVPMLTLPMGEKRFQVCGTLEQIESIKEHLTLEFDLVLGRYSYYCEPTLKPVLDELGIKHISFEKRWAKMIQTLLVSKSKEFFSLNDVQKHLNKMNETHGEMIKELIRVMPSAKATEVFQRLLTEQVSIRNMNTILASLIDWGQRERDPIVITEQVRRALFEQITHQHLDGNVLRVLSLDNELEQFIRENLRSDGSDTFVDIDSTSLNKVTQMISAQYKEWAHCEHLPVAVCSMDVRPHFRALIHDKLKAIPVMSYQEISANRELQFLGSIRFDESLLEQDNNQGVENQ